MNIFLALVCLTIWQFDIRSWFLTNLDFCTSWFGFFKKNVGTYADHQLLFVKALHALTFDKIEMIYKKINKQNRQTDRRNGFYLSASATADQTIFKRSHFFFLVPVKMCAFAIFSAVFAVTKLKKWLVIMPRHLLAREKRKWILLKAWNKQCCHLLLIMPDELHSTATLGGKSFKYLVNFGKF